ncbi:MAG TPA: metallophosphoesterase [Chthonomonadaceae bacterium]|nr:metallophosphoesterase [Chthonomonadaceae bacterium]
MKSTRIPIDIGRSRPYMLEITAQDVPLCGLPEALCGATLVHMSDLHAGFSNLEPVYEEAIARVNALQPDFIVLTGDYIDDHSREPNYPMPGILRRFRARRGVYGSFGNHDHRRGIVGSRRVLEQGGVRVLNNEALCVEPGLWLAGVDDLYEGQPDIAGTLAGIPDDVTGIVLSHNPRLIEKVGHRDVFVLSGHTHGGQIALPFPTPKMVCWLHLRCPQVAGWYKNGRARLYVNRGMGVTGRPLRYNCPAEIGVFRLTPAPEERGALKGNRSRAATPPEPVGRL